MFFYHRNIQGISKYIQLHNYTVTNLLTKSISSRDGVLSSDQNNGNKHRAAWDGEGRLGQHQEELGR